MNKTTTNNHYVLYVQPKTERKVESELLKMGIKAYVPIKRQLNQWKDRKHWVDMVMFSRYVFVEASQNRKNDVFNISYVKRYIQFDGKPATLNEKEIVLIHELCKLKQEVEIAQYKPCIGQIVEIMSGQLIGYRGKIKEEPKGKMLRIEIPGLGCFAQVALDSFSVRVV